jgi:hypothetical protein
MPDAKRLRDIAARMLAVAVDAKDQKFQELLSKRAGEYLDQAAVLEAAGSSAPQETTPQAQHPQPDSPQKRK